MFNALFRLPVVMYSEYAAKASTVVEDMVCPN
jgi:hypothetical protein